MNSMRLAWCLSLGIHAFAFGVLGYAGFFHHPAQLAGDDEQQLLTVVVVPDDSPPVTTPKATAIIPPQPVKLPEPAKPIKLPEPVNPAPPVDQQTVQKVAKLPDPLATRVEPEPVTSPPAQPVLVAVAQPARPPPATTAIDSPARNDSVATPQTVAARARPDYRKNPAPRYPASALRRHEEGTVLLRVVVSAEGHSKRVEVKQSSGFPLLDDAAIEAVKDWEFDPARIGTVPVESEIAVPIRFTLQR